METLNTKWMATVASIWIQCSSGATYTFGIYSPILKSSQSYDQSTLGTVSVFKDIGANVGVLSGFLYSAVTLRRGGPWVVHLTGVIQIFVGYFFMWAAVVGLIRRPPVAVMCVFMFVAAHAQTFFNTANVVSGVHNFGDYGGTIVGIMKGCLGLSGAMLIQFYETVCEGHPSTYILLLALTPTTVSLLLMSFVRNYDSNSKNDKKHLNAFSGIALAIAAYLMVGIILKNVFTLSLGIRIIMFVILLLLLASPVGVAIRATKEESDRLDQALLVEKDHKPNLSMPSKSRIEEDSEFQAPMDSEGGDLNLLQAMRQLNFWLLCICIFCGLGSGLATVNNISQVGESLSYTTMETNSLVSLWSIWNFLGRFGAGFLSDIFLHKYGWARPIFMSVTLAAMAIGHTIIASGIPKTLYLGSILVGISYGSQWSLMPTISSEIFGVGHLGTIFNTIAVASPVGSYVFSVRVVGYIYDKVATGDGRTCYGSHCFMLSFLIMACVALFGAFVALVLHIRTRRFYATVVIPRLQHS